MWPKLNTGKCRQYFGIIHLIAGVLFKSTIMDSSANGSNAQALSQFYLNYVSF